MGAWLQPRPSSYFFNLIITQEGRKMFNKIRKMVIQDDFILNLLIILAGVTIVNSLISIFMLLK